MFKKSSSDSSNFWISYADLMAGLLFVFILLIGAIVSKSMILQKSLEEKKSKLEQLSHNLQEQKKALLTTTKTLNEKEKGIAKLNKTIAQKDATIKLQQEEIVELKSLLQERLNELQKSQNNLKKAKETLKITQNELQLKENEINKLNQLLLARNSKLDELNGKVILLQNLLQESNTTLAQKDKKIQEYKNKVLILSKNLTKKEDELHLSDKKLKKLLEALDKKQSNYEKLLAKLQEQKAKIKYLTGIKLRVIDELKQTLGNRVTIAKDGALRLNSKILFDKGSSELKEGAKEELQKLFSEYIKALMSNRAIAPYIETIVIEGHTDSDGGYLYNLQLSQERALAVMNYLLSLPIAKEYNLKKLLTASGRSYVDRVMTNGKEDKEASRRIEVKFRLKNQNALYEIEKILDENNTL